MPKHNRSDDSDYNRSDDSNYNRSDDSDDDNGETREIQLIRTTGGPVTRKTGVNGHTRYWFFEDEPSFTRAYSLVDADVAASKVTQMSKADSWQECLVLSISEGRKMTMASHTLCDQLLQGDRAPATFPGYCAEHRCTVQKRAATASRAIIQRDILPIVVPSIENFKLLNLEFSDKDKLGHFGEELNVEWILAEGMGGKHPNPSYAVGLQPSAFTATTLDKLMDYHTPLTPVVLGREICYPLVIAEVCDAQGIYEAQMQAVKAGAIAVNSQIQLFQRAYGELHAKTKELYGQALVFSLCHSHDEVQIFAHYAERQCQELQFHRRKLAIISLTTNNGKYQNLPNTFVENVYKTYGPIHLKRIREAAETEWPSNAE